MHEEETRLAARIGAAIRRHRQLHGLSQEALAERIDLSSHFVGLVERGKELPSLTTLLALAHAFGVTLDDLLGEAESAAPATWERHALALLRTVPADFRTGVLAMLRALAQTPHRSPPRVTYAASETRKGTQMLAEPDGARPKRPRGTSRRR